jgi:hypothetical protein
MDAKTWGWIKVLAGLIVLWFVWNSGAAIGMNLAGGVVILALLTMIGGYFKTTAKGR